MSNQRQRFKRSKKYMIKFFNKKLYNSDGVMLTKGSIHTRSNEFSSISIERFKKAWYQQFRQAVKASIIMNTLRDISVFKNLWQQKLK